MPRAIEAGRVWVNCYHAYPAHAPFGGYKQSGFGRETHKMMLAHYRQVRDPIPSSRPWPFSLLVGGVSYSYAACSRCSPARLMTHMGAR